MYAPPQAEMRPCTWTMNGIVREGRVVKSSNAERRSVEISGREWISRRGTYRIVGNNSQRSGILQVIDDVNDWRFEVLHDLRSFAFAIFS